MRRLVVVIVSVAFALVGCTGSSEPSQNVADAEHTAPAVSKPKDARGVAPCALLTAVQATALGLDPTRARAGATADLVDCDWPSVQPPISGIGVTVDTNPTRRGLTDTYLKRDTFPIFEPTVIDGYPAVRAEYGSSPDCSVQVGLSDTQEIRVDGDARSATDTCGLVKRVIAAMLTNIPAQR